MEALVQKRCSAKSKRSGERCRRRPSIGREVCVMHGAKGGRPIVHGRFSQLPARISHAYMESLSDPSLFDLSQTIAAMDALVKVQMARVEQGDSPAFREEALALWTGYRDELRKENGDPLKAMDALEDHLEAGEAITRAEQDLVERLEALSKRIEEAWKIRLAQKNAVNGKDLGELLFMILGQVRAAAPPDVAAKIVEAVTKLIDGRGVTLIASRAS